MLQSSNPLNPLKVLSKIINLFPTTQQAGQELEQYLKNLQTEDYSEQIQTLAKSCNEILAQRIPQLPVEDNDTNANSYLFQILNIEPQKIEKPQQIINQIQQNTVQVIQVQTQQPPVNQLAEQKLELQIQETSIKQVDKGNSIKQIDIGNSIKQIDIGNSIKQIDIGNSIKQIDIGSSIKQIDIGSSIKQIDIGSSIKQIDIGSSTKYEFEKQEQEKLYHNHGNNHNFKQNKWKQDNQANNGQQYNQWKYFNKEKGMDFSNQSGYFSGKEFENKKTFTLKDQNIQIKNVIKEDINQKKPDEIAQIPYKRQRDEPQNQESQIKQQKEVQPVNEINNKAKPVEIRREGRVTIGPLPMQQYSTNYQSYKSKNRKKPENNDQINRLI